MKKLLSVATVTTFFLSLALTTHAATNTECKILAAKDDTVIMDCGKLARKMEVGDKVKLRTRNIKKKSEIEEGC